MYTHTHTHRGVHACTRTHKRAHTPCLLFIQGNRYPAPGSHYIIQPSGWGGQEDITVPLRPGPMVPHLPTGFAPTKTQSATINNTAQTSCSDSS